MKFMLTLFGIICVYTMGWSVGYISGHDYSPTTETVYLDVCGPETIGL